MPGSRGFPIIAEKSGPGRKEASVARVGVMADAYYAHATMPGARILFAKPPIGFPRGTCQGRIMESALCIRQILFPCLLADERKPRHCETLLIPAAFKPVLNPLDTSIFIFSLHVSRRLVSPRVNGISESFRRTWSTR